VRARSWRGAAAGLALAAALAAAPLVHAQPPEDFRVESEPDLLGRGNRVTGYIYNQTRYRVTNVRVRVESLDAGGQVVGETLGWALGSIPESGGRTYFQIPVRTRGASYRVTVVGFDRTSGGAP
jgi:hypothetical protein